MQIIVLWIFARGGEIMIFSVVLLYYFKEDCRLFSIGMNTTCFSSYDRLSRQRRAETQFLFFLILETLLNVIISSRLLNSYNIARAHEIIEVNILTSIWVPNSEFYGQIMYLSAILKMTF